MQNFYKRLPKVDELLENEQIKNLIDSYSRKIVLDKIRENLDLLREEIKNGISEDLFEDRISNFTKLLSNRLSDSSKHHLVKLVNATGVVIHTNLGRSPITREIMEEIAEVSCGYSNLEYDLDAGKRGSRYSHLVDILQKITGAESAMVVNNNAAAVMLILSTLANGKEVITSRGELIEIGGAFRIPDVCERSGARLKEVGATNKTHLKDYENAITEDTAAFLKVHTSNYRVMGFSESVKASDLLELKKKHGLYIIEDLGSGVLIDLSKYGLEYEPTVKDAIESGVDVLSFSGDKLLGGPQAGIIVGKKEIIDRLQKNPLTRALRVDKFTISALETVLRYYEDEKIAIKKLPTLRMLTYTKEELLERANKLFDMIKKDLNDYIKVEICEVDSEVGGGSMPLEKLPSYAIALSSDKISTDRIEKQLRNSKVAIILRVIKDRAILDLRTIQDDEFGLVAESIKQMVI